MFKIMSRLTDRLVNKLVEIEEGSFVRNGSKELIDKINFYQRKNESISAFVGRMVQEASEHSIELVGIYNQILITATNESTVEDVMAHYQNQRDIAFGQLR